MLKRLESKIYPRLNLETATSTKDKFTLGKTGINEMSPLACGPDTTALVDPRASKCRRKLSQRNHGVRGERYTVILNKTNWLTTPLIKRKQINSDII